MASARCSLRCLHLSPVRPNIELGSPRSTIVARKRDAERLKRGVSRRYVAGWTGLEYAYVVECVLFAMSFQRGFDREPAQLEKAIRRGDRVRVSKVHRDASGNAHSYELEIESVNL